MIFYSIRLSDDEKLMKKTLIIGYGNSLRSDDGIGRYLAEKIEREQWPNIQTLSVHQLTPELVTVIAAVDQVIFLDAQSNLQDNNLQLQELSPKISPTGLGHRGDPGELLALTQQLYGQAPRAWWLLIPAHHFDWGETFSDVTNQAIPVAIQWLRVLILWSA